MCEKLCIFFFKVTFKKKRRKICGHGQFKVSRPSRRGHKLFNSTTVSIQSREEFAKSIIRKSSKAPTSEVYFSSLPKPDVDNYVEIEVFMGDFRTCRVSETQR